MATRLFSEPPVPMSLDDRKANLKRLPWVTWLYRSQECQGWKTGGRACRNRAPWRYVHGGGGQETLCTNHLLVRVYQQDERERRRIDGWFAENGWQVTVPDDQPAEPEDVSHKGLGLP